jgi:hypothetical protein
MADLKGTIGSHLLSLKERSGLSLDSIAERGGYSGKSSVQRIFNARYNPSFLTPTVIAKLRLALEGEGIPPITADDFAIFGDYAAEKEVETAKLSSANQMPVYKMVRSKPAYVDSLGTVVETCILKERKAIFAKPPSLYGSSVGAVQVDVGMMSPRYLFGDMIVIDFSGSSTEARDALIILNTQDGEYALAIFGRIQGIGDTVVSIYQYDPSVVYHVNRDDIADIFPVLPTASLLSPLPADAFSA